MMAVLMVVALASCKAEKNEEPEELVDANVYVLTGPTGIGAVNMWYESENDEALANFHFNAAAAPDEVVSKISTGEADIAAVATNLAAKLYNKTEGKIKILAVNTLGVLNVLDNTGAAINSIADLKGRKIVTTGQGSNPEFVINHLLKQNGIDPEKDVTIEFKAEGSELPAVWATDPEAIIIAPQPVATAIKGKYENSKIVLDLTNEWKKTNADSELMMGCVIVRAEFLEAHPATVKQFLAAYEKSVNNAVSDPENTGILCEKYGIVAAAKMAQAAIPACNLCFITGDEMKQKLTGYLQVLFDADPTSVGGKMPDDGFWYAA